MTLTVAAIFATVYVGMILGGLPFLQLDRTGAARIVNDVTMQAAEDADQWA